MLLGSAARANSGFKPMLLYHFCYPLFISIRFATTNAISDRFKLFFGECFIDSFYPTRKTAYWPRRQFDRRLTVYQPWGTSQRIATIAAET